MQEDKLTSSPGTTTPLTEDQIVAATVGERKPFNSAVYLAPYDPAWPSLFNRLKKQIREALGDKILLLEHVGSTAVPGLSAKPIIDMVLVVFIYVKPLEKKGYTLRNREPDWHEHRLLKLPDVEGKLHVFSAGCEEIGQMLLFRDRLRNNTDNRLLYEETKRELAARTWKYRQNYADAKSEVVQEILARARRNQT